MKIGIIGAGFVGSTTAYTLVIKGLAEEIVLIDLNSEKAEAEALDILHAAAMNNPCKVYCGGYEDLKNADIVVLTVDGQKTLVADRLELLESNGKILHSLIPEIVKQAPNCILLLATNPVDVMTRLAQEISGFPKQRVIGSGTVLDSARFRALLGEKLGLCPQSIHAYVLGEHGSSSVVSWSTASIGGVKIEEYAAKIGRPISKDEQKEIAKQVIDAGFKISRGKKATYYGIASSLVKIIEAIAFDKKCDLTVSTLHEDVYGISNICLSLPTLVGKAGAYQTVLPNLSENEMIALKKSAVVMEQADKKAEKQQ